jgi:serine/threonine-protein kinase
VRNGREAAIKLLHPSVSADPAARERFLQEGYAANQVGHPGTVQVLDDGVAREGAYLVIKLLDGVPVDKLAEEHGERLPLTLTLAITDAALEVLATAHAKGIVHRDFKPENLFLTVDRRLKMLDFGLARLRETTGGARLTATGVPMGTPAFMPPEQALAHWDRVDARADVFAVGASVWTLLTGRLVHDARTTPELLVMASTRQAASLRTVAPSIPADIVAVIDRALAFEPQRRFASADEMRRALHAAMKSSGLAFVPLSEIDVQRVLRHAEQPTLARGGRASAARGMVPAQSPTPTVSPLTSDSQPGRRGKRQLLSMVAIAALLGVGGGIAAYVRTTMTPDDPAESPVTRADEPPQVERGPEGPAVSLPNPSPSVASSATASSTPSAVASAVATSTPSAVAPSTGAGATTSAPAPSVRTAAPVGKPSATSRATTSEPTATAKPCDPLQGVYCPKKR